MEEATKKFTRRVEDFVCGHCGREVTGNGYTNHCPQCLYSKHVDHFPGDRLVMCGGLMVPTALEPFEDTYKIVHRCERCGLEKKNRVVAGDNFESLLDVTKTFVHQWKQKGKYLGK